MDEMRSRQLLIHHPEGFGQDYLQLIDKIIHMNKNKITVQAVTAPYEDISGEGNSKRVQVLFVKYATPAQARKALDIFHNAYLHEHQKGVAPGVTNKKSNFFNIEDGWLGYSLDGTGLSIVFECPNQESAQMILTHISGNTVNKENNHGE
jgi:hypothetical protein